MSAGHTDGPWRLNAGDSIKVMNPRGLYVALATCGGMSGIKLDEAEANARLIAAAPDLLATVRELLALHAAHHNAIEHAAARKVIAKATGQ